MSKWTVVSAAILAIWIAIQVGCAPPPAPGTTAPGPRDKMFQEATPVTYISTSIVRSVDREFGVVCYSGYHSDVCFTLDSRGMAK